MLLSTLILVSIAFSIAGSSCRCNASAVGGHGHYSVPSFADRIVVCPALSVWFMECTVDGDRISLRVILNAVSSNSAVTAEVVVAKMKVRRIKLKENVED